MIRVIYRWRVQQGQQERFKAVWAKTTTRIEATTPGARGSMLLQNQQDASEFVTIARWDGVEHWQAFWGEASKTAMREMHALAERLSADAFEEIEDYTV